MAADLFLPILFIVIMFMIIRELDDALTLLMVALLFLPVALAFGKMINNGAFTTLFQADITSLGISSVIMNLIGAAMFTIPLFAGTRILYLRHEIRTAKK